MDDISSDVNYIFALINSGDELCEVAKIYSEKNIKGNYKKYHLLQSCVISLMNTYTYKVQTAYIIVSTAFQQIYTKYGGKVIEPSAFQQEVQAEIDTRLTPGCGTSRNFVNVILSDFSIISLLDPQRRFEAAQKYLYSDLNEDIKKKLEYFKFVLEDKFDIHEFVHTRSYLLFHPRYAEILNELAEKARTKKLFIDKHGKVDWEDMRIAAELLALSEKDGVNADFITSDEQFYQSLTDVCPPGIRVHFIDRKQVPVTSSA